MKFPGLANYLVLSYQIIAQPYLVARKLKLFLAGPKGQLFNSHFPSVPYCLSPPLSWGRYFLLYDSHDQNNPQRGHSTKKSKKTSSHSNSILRWPWFLIFLSMRLRSGVIVIAFDISNKNTESYQNLKLSSITMN